MVAPKKSDRFDPIGTHLASLNLFYEQDGTVEITVAGGGLPGGLDNIRGVARVRGVEIVRPIDFIEELIIEAAERMKTRRAGR